MPSPNPERRVFGRERELAVLQKLHESTAPAVVLLEGLPGIGKSALLHSFGQAQGLVQILDCRTIEPTKACFLEALESAAFAMGGDQIRVLCLDHYDHFILLDAWIRGKLLGQLGARTRLVLAGHTLPKVPWAMAGCRVETLKLGVLGETATIDFLASSGVTGDAAKRVRKFTKGHPLALQLAASQAGELLEDQSELAAPLEVVYWLTRYFMESVEDPKTRRALEAASAVRRVTRPLLSAMLGHDADDELFHTLAALPLVDLRRDGLSLHPTVHETVARWLRSTDPAAFNSYRRLAWQALESAGEHVSSEDLWRHTADVIYLVDDPVIGGAFFPGDNRRYSVEPAADGDRDSILDITKKYDSPENCKAIELWLAAVPSAFHAVRDDARQVQGYYCLLDPGAVDSSALDADPVTREWQRNLPTSQQNVPRRALFLRRWLSLEHGDLPSEIQAACWLDVKRAYLEGRPDLRRVYLATSDLTPYVPVATKLGFAPGETIAGLMTAMLDFGSGSVDGWFGRLVGASLGMKETVSLEADTHSLKVDGASLALTPREFAVVQVLVAAKGAAVSRDSLLQSAWEGGYSVGSNVVDVLVRGLRKKMGKSAQVLATVRGVGYRWDN